MRDSVSSGLMLVEKFSSNLLRLRQYKDRWQPSSKIWKTGMKHTVTIFSLFAVIAVPGATAQSHGSNQCLRLESVYQRLMLKPDNSTPLVPQSEQRSSPQEKEQQFWLKTEKFIEAWTALTTEYNEKGTFNVKKAKQASKAFHNLEKTEGWPK